MTFRVHPIGQLLLCLSLGGCCERAAAPSNVSIEAVNQLHYRLNTTLFPLGLRARYCGYLRQTDAASRERLDASTFTTWEIIGGDSEAGTSLMNSYGKISLMEAGHATAGGVVIPIRSADLGGTFVWCFIGNGEHTSSITDALTNQFAK